VITDTGDKIHLAHTVEGMLPHCTARAVPAWGAYPAMLESSSLESSCAELIEIREHFRRYDAADLAAPRWWVETRCHRRWRQMATTEDEAELRPGTTGPWGMRFGDRACSKCGTPEYGDVPPASLLRTSFDW
jgi:hypothetical protein